MEKLSNSFITYMHYNAFLLKKKSSLTINMKQKLAGKGWTRRHTKEKRRNNHSKGNIIRQKRWGIPWIRRIFDTYKYQKAEKPWSI
jgi:hypothetical protein